MTAEIQQLSKPDLAKWLSTVFFDWFIIVAALVFVSLTFQLEQVLSWLVVIPAVIVIGSRQHALGILGHDGAHRLACSNKWWNDFLTSLFCFWPFGFSIRGYRSFHFRHHQTVGTDLDPEIVHTRHDKLGQWKLPLEPQRLFKQILGDLIGGSLPHLKMASKLTNASTVVPLILIPLAVIICYWFGLLWVLLLWAVSLVTVFWISFRLRIWTEHTVELESDPTHRIKAKWWQQFLFLPHNTWCHWEHHLYPQVPYWNLPRVRELTLDTGPEVISVEELVRKLCSK